MPGTISIQTKPGCDANEVTMTLSGTAEPNGGDHYATIDFTGQSQNRILVGLVSVQWEVTPGNWIGVTIQSFLFTSAGETYTLRAYGNNILMNWPAIKFPYTVHGIYAPGWAAIDGVISGNPVDEACCTPSGESFAAETIHNTSGRVYTIIQYASNPPPACGSRVSAPWTFYNACPVNTPYVVTLYRTPAITIYDWLAKAFSVSHTFNLSHSAYGVFASTVVQITVTKVANEAFATYTFTATGDVGGTVNDTDDLPYSHLAPVDIVDLDIPCSAYKIRLNCSGYTYGLWFAAGGVNVNSSMDSFVASFYRPT